MRVTFLSLCRLIMGWGRVLLSFLFCPHYILAPLLFRFNLLPGRAVLLSYIDDATILVQSKTWDDNLCKLTNTYQHVFNFAESMGLVLEHSKLKVFHFLCSSWEVNPLIDLGYAPFTGDTPLVPKDFDHALTMLEHLQRYSNKALIVMNFFTFILS